VNKPSAFSTTTARREGRGLAHSPTIPIVCCQKSCFSKDERSVTVLEPKPVSYGGLKMSSSKINTKTYKRLNKKV